LYPFPPKNPVNNSQQLKGATIMSNKKLPNILPQILPEYTITKSTEPPFEVKWEELMGWFIVPKLGETCDWGLYNYPERKITEAYSISVTGKSIVHGIEGVSILVKRLIADGTPVAEVLPDHNWDIHFVAQLTDTHSRFLAEGHFSYSRNAWRYLTFLDGDKEYEDVSGSFFSNWGFGEDNCGNEINLRAKDDIICDGDVITSKDKPFLLDIVGRYTVEINGKSYDTVCVADIETYNSGVASVQYIDRNEHTVLWRRFNRDDWHLDHYKQRWSEKLPDSERLTINGTTYVHWYDCITDYVV
jgi:hypothetical protein